MKDRLLPNMTIKGLAEKAMHLDPGLDPDTLYQMKAPSLLALLSDLEPAGSQPHLDPEPIDPTLIDTAERDGEGKPAPHRSRSPSRHWFNRNNRSGRERKRK